MPLTGGAVTVLVPNDPGVTDIAVEGTAVFWSNGQTGNISTVERRGGEPRVVATGLDNPRHVELDGSAVFWESGGVVYRLPLSSG